MRTKLEFLNVIKREKPFIILVLFLVLLYFLTSAFIPSSKTPENKELVQDIYKEIDIALSNTSIANEFRQNILFRYVFIFFSSTCFLLFSIGIFLNIYYFILRRKPNLPNAAILPCRWSILDIFKVVVLIIFSWLIFSIFVHIIFDILDIDTAGNLISSLAVSTLLHFIGIGCLFLYIRRKYNAKASSLGLVKSNFLKNILTGILGYSSIIPATLGSLIIAGMVSYYFGYEREVNPLVSVYFMPSKPLVMFYLIFFICVIGPICEEIFFRGFLYKALRGKLNIGISIIAGSVIFSLLHVDPIGFVPIFILSIMLSYMYEKTGSLVVPITGHIIHNSIVSMFMIIIRMIVI